MILIEEQNGIAEKLRVYVARFSSQNEAAKTLNGVSAATVSQLLNNNWELINGEMWRNIATQIDYTTSQWEVVQTRDFKLLTHLLSDAQQSSQVFAVTGEAGSGKTLALKQYVANNKRAYLLSCNEYWNRKYFLAELMRKMGRESGGLTVAEMMYEVVQVLKKRDCPVIIFDEADKLTDQVLYFFITLYNELEDHCGLVLVATDHLAKRINRGLKLNKKGYKEIYSRIGSKFIELKGVGFTDVTQVCIANGVVAKKDIREIFEDSEDDLRRVKRKIHAVKMIKNQLNAA